MDLGLYCSGKKAMRSLRKSAISGFKWSTLSQVGRQGTQLVTTIILARLLVPADFGLVSMSMVVIGFINVFKDLGTAAAVIQRKEVSSHLLSSIFWVNVVFSTLATCIIFFGSSTISVFYKEPRIIPIISVLSLSIIFSGFSSVQQALLERSLNFNLLAKIEIIATISGATIGIISALIGVGVWSLVYQTLSATLIATILLWMSASWRPQCVFSWREVKSVCHFSLNLTGFNIFNFFVRNADNLLIGRYLGAQNLGYYNLAYRLLLYPIQNVSVVVTRVMFPIYSQMQDNSEAFKKTYLKVLSVIALITFPMMLGLMAICDGLIISIFGSNWSPVINLILVFAPLGLVQSLATTVGSIYQAKGKTDLLLYWGIGSGVLLIGSFVIGLPWGIWGVGVSYALMSLVLFFPSIIIPFRLISLSLKEALSVVWRPFVSSFIMMVCVYYFKLIVVSRTVKIVSLSISILVGVIVYLIISWILNRNQLNSLLKNFGVQKNGE